MPAPSPLRIAHVVPALFGKDGVYGGGERYALELARAMAEVTPTSLITFGKNPRSEQRGALQVEVLHNYSSRWNNPINPKLLLLMRRFDVVHVHQTHTWPASMAAVLGKLAGKPKVFTSDLGGGGRSLQHYLDITGWYASHLHISRYSRHIHGHDGFSNAAVIYGGVDTEFFSPDPSVVRQREVVFVGRVLPHKGVDVLIDAMPADLPLRIVGRTHGTPPQYLALLKQKAQGKKVIFDEGVEDADLVNVYRRALCVVLPSVYKTALGDTTKVPELLGQTVIEAMACGTPVISSDAASLPEVVEDGVTGFTARVSDVKDLAAAITKLAEDGALRDRMGAAGRERVLTHFTWTATVNRCLMHYRAAV